MFCEKCGNKLNDGDKFCMKCGTPVPQDNAPQQTVPAQPVAPTPQETAPAPQETTPVQPVDYVPQETTPVQPVAPAKPKEPRKPMSPKTKKLIIFSSIGAGVLAIVLILLFVVIIPMMNRIDPTKYVQVSFNEEMLYDGYLSGDVGVDSEAIFVEHIGEEKAIEDYSWKDLLNGLSSDGPSASTVSDVFDYCNITVAVKGVEATEATTGEDEEDYYEYDEGKLDFENLKSEDVLIVTFDWDDSPLEVKKAEIAEKRAGITFDRSDKTVEVKVADALAKNELVVKEPVVIDLFKYIDDNNLVNTIGISDGNLGLVIGDFTFSEGGYDFVKEESSAVSIKDGSGEEYYVEFDYSTSRSKDNGEEVEVEIDGYYSEITDDNHLIGTDIFFATRQKTYTVTANNAMTLDEAKANIELIKKNAPQVIDDYSWRDIKAEIKEVYYLQPKSAEDTYKNRIVILYQDTNETKDFGSHVVSNVYLYGDTFNFEAESDEFIWKDETLKDVREGSYVLSKDTAYTATKIG